MTAHQYSYRMSELRGKMSQNIIQPDEWAEYYRIRREMNIRLSDTIIFDEQYIKEVIDMDNIALGMMLFLNENISDEVKIFLRLKYGFQIHDD